MKLMTVFGTRPEIIRLSRVIAALDPFCEHTLVYTGQNYDPNLSDVFFQELVVRPPDIHVNVQSTGLPIRLDRSLCVRAKSLASTNQTGG